MASRKRMPEPSRRPATTPKGREDQLASLAYDLAEKQLMDGSASSAVISHFLKQASPRETLERERLEQENALLRAKVEQLASAKKSEEIYVLALQAMRSYTGQEELPEGDSEDEYDDY